MDESLKYFHCDPNLENLIQSTLPSDLVLPFYSMSRRPSQVVFSDKTLGSLKAKIKSKHRPRQIEQEQYT